MNRTTLLAAASWLVTFGMLIMLALVLAKMADGQVLPPKPPPPSIDRLIKDTLSDVWENDPWKGKWGHMVPGCDLPARAAKNPDKVAPCKCPGMVRGHQEPLIYQCWVEGGAELPPMSVKIEGQPAWLLMLPPVPPKEVLECLEKVPDHCEIVAQSGVYDVPEGMEEEVKCRTSCKPERCFCPDHACKSHEESMEY